MIITEINKNLLTISDITYLNKSCKYFNITSDIYIKWDNLKKKHPDIWVILKKPYNIYVTQEWSIQNICERRKRLTHELYHIVGGIHWINPKFILLEKLLKFFNRKKLPLPFIKFIVEHNKQNILSYFIVHFLLKIHFLGFYIIVYWRINMSQIWNF